MSPKIITQDNIRDSAGARSVIKTDKHEGILRRPTETRKQRIDEFTANEVNKSKEPESPMANPFFGSGGKEGK